MIPAKPYGKSNARQTPTRSKMIPAKPYGKSNVPQTPTRSKYA